MGRAARLGSNVIVLDEAGHWRGIGTAWKLAEDGHQVTLVTPAPFVAQGLHRSASDVPVRTRLAQLGVRFITETAITNWSGSTASIQSLLTAETTFLDAESLVLATGRRSVDAMANDLHQERFSVQIIGDALAPRNAAAAIYEGRKTGLSL